MDFYDNLRSFTAASYDFNRIRFSEKSPKDNQQCLRLSDDNVPEKSGNIGLCPPILRQTLVENRLDDASGIRAYYAFRQDRE